MAAVFGANGVAARLAVGAISPMVLVSLRWGFVAAALAAIFRRDDWRELGLLLRTHPWRLAWMGLVGFSGFNALFYLAAYYTTAVNMMLMQSAIPALVLAGSAVAFRTRVTALQVIGLLLTMLGVLVVAAKGDLHDLLRLAINRGDALILLTDVFYAAYTLGLRPRPTGSPLVFFAGLSLAALAWSLPLSVGEVALGRSHWPTPEGWLVTLFIAFGPSFTGQLAFMRGVELIGPARAGLFTNLIPIFGALSALAVLGERFTLAHASAALLGLGGITLAEWRGLPRRRPGGRAAGAASAVHVEAAGDARLP